MWKYALMLFSAALYADLDVDVILTDIEGTTTSISFVHDTLFPYAKEHIGSFLVEHSKDPKVDTLINEIVEIAHLEDRSIEKVVVQLQEWMEQDKKITPLKTLQGMMWKNGYEIKAFQGHVYQDAYLGINRFQQMGLSIYVYSSGSTDAQKLLFGHSTFGDMTPLFSGYFDTKIGGKKDPLSYQKIAHELQTPTERILFLSDSKEEIDAASKVGMKTVLFDREKAIPISERMSISSFDEISFE
jgi:enolase-phosphatase E1